MVRRWAALVTTGVPLAAIGICFLTKDRRTNDQLRTALAEQTRLLERTRLCLTDSSVQLAGTATDHEAVLQSLQNALVENGGPRGHHCSIGDDGSIVRAQGRRIREYLNSAIARTCASPWRKQQLRAKHSRNASCA